MRRMLPTLLPALAALLLIAGCSGIGRPGGVALPTSEASPASSAPQPAPPGGTQAPGPAGTPAGLSAGTAAAPNGTALPVPVQTARNFVANLAGVDPTQVQVETFEQVDWPDACLGVTKADEACAQVVTPGYRIVFTTPKGPYELHTDLTGTNARLAGAAAVETPARAAGGAATATAAAVAAPTPAEASAGGPSPLPTGIPLGGILPLPVPALTATLSERFGLPAAQLTLVGAEAVQWSDACLGAPGKGEMCAQVITPGYRLVFDSPSGQYEVHTDESGQNVRVIKK